MAGEAGAASAVSAKRHCGDRTLEMAEALPSLPATVLDALFERLDSASVVAVANTCRLLHQAANGFAARWLRRVALPARVGEADWDDAPPLRRFWIARSPLEGRTVRLLAEDDTPAFRARLRLFGAFPERCAPDNGNGDDDDDDGDSEDVDEEEGAGRDWRQEPIAADALTLVTSAHMLVSALDMTRNIGDEAFVMAAYAGLPLPLLRELCIEFPEFPDDSYGTNKYMYRWRLPRLRVLSGAGLYGSWASTLSDRLETIKIQCSQVLPSSLGQLRNLQCLELMYCDKLAMQPDWLASLGSLRRLACSHADVWSKLADTPSQWAHLRELYLSYHADVVPLGRVLAAHPQLRVLELGGCYLADFGASTLPRQLESFVVKWYCEGVPGPYPDSVRPLRAPVSSRCAS